MLSKLLEEELINIVGAENVLTDAPTLEQYSKDMSFVPPMRPRCVVKPKTSDEIQKIVKLANKTLTPLVAVSSGPPHFKGDTVPSVGGAAIVDLSRMKRIIRIDRRNRVVLVEPGVTFPELAQALAKEDLAPLLPLLPRSTKSVVASALETDPIILPKYHWDVQDPLRCVEVIFGNGELFRSGDAVGPGDLEDQWKVGKAQSRGLGPAYIDFTKLVQRVQGTLGIVTWASIGCRPLPKVKEAYIIPSENLESLIELAYKILWRRLGAVCLILNNCNFACILKEDGQSIERLRENLPSWLLLFTIETSGLYPDKKLEYQRSELISLSQFFGLEPLSTVFGISAEEVMKLIHGELPSAYRSHWKLRFKGSCQEVFFTTTLNRVPEFVKKVFELAGLYKFAAKDIGIYIQPIVQGTSCHCEFDLYYDPQNLEEANLVKNFSYEMIRALIKIGAFFARPYPLFKDIAIPYVAAPYIITARKIKSIFDPNNIMNPGKLYFV